jgi:hypothetical protein
LFDERIDFVFLKGDFFSRVSKSILFMYLIAEESTSSEKVKSVRLAGGVGGRQMYNLKKREENEEEKKKKTRSIIISSKASERLRDLWSLVSGQQEACAVSVLNCVKSTNASRGWDAPFPFVAVSSHVTLGGASSCL